MFEISGSMLISGLINGLCLAGIYILIALGLTLILSIMNILQFAHGEIFMLGAFVSYYIILNLGINPILAILFSMIVTAILGFILERVMFRPLMGKFLPVMCATTGLMLILQTSAVLGFGLDSKHIPSIWPGTLDILTLSISNNRLAALIACIIFTLILFLFLKRSRFGQAIIATAQNREGALIQGINPNLMYSMVMMIGSALAAIGGSFAGSIFILDPFMGTTALTKGIAIIVIGGMGSLQGVIIGAIILGLADGLIAIAFGPAIAAIAPLIIVILILTIKPEGLFGHD